MPSVSDQSFESQFANLAYTFLQDRAPALMDYNLGFQVVDKNDEGTRGLGVFGLRIGKEIAYIPAFFIGGEIKGVDQIYAVNADLFVPLTEDWVNYFLHRKPYEIGEPTDEPRGRRGIRSNRLREIFNNIPGGSGVGFQKVGGELGLDPHMAEVCDRILTKTANGVWDEDFQSSIGLFVDGDDVAMTTPQILGALGPKIAMAFIEQMKRDPKLAEAVLETYEPSALAEDLVNGNRVPNTDGPPPAVEEEKGEEQTKGSTELPEGDVVALKDIDEMVEVITDQQAIDITDEERERLMAGERVIRDHRTDDESSVLYEMEIKKELTNPQGPGVYDVLMGDGTFATTLVLEPKTFGVGRTAGVYLLAQPHRKSVTSYWKADILTRVQYPDNRLRETWEEAGSDPTKVKRGDKVVFFNERGQSTFPAVVREKITGPNGQIILWVEPDYYVVERDHTAWIGERYTGPARIPEDRAIVTDDGKAMDDRWKYNVGMYELERGGEDRGNRVIIDQGSGSYAIRQTGSTTIIDRDKFKALKVNKRMKSRGDYGTTADLYAGVGKFAKELCVERDGVEYSIRSPLGRFDRLTKTAAFDKLLRDHGLRESDADHLLDKATPHGYRCRIKLAEHVKKAFDLDPDALDDYGYVDSSGRWTVTPQSMVQTSYDTERVDPEETYGYEPGNEDYRNLADIYKSDVDAISTAGQIGNKEVLDTSVLTGLLNVHDVGAKIDKFIPSLMSGLDKMGRLLFMLYWHWDKFEEQYGKQDTIELEDKLKQVFEHTGELVIFLHQRSLFGSPEAAGVGVI